MSKDSVRIGAINWDDVLPEDTYFGGHALRSLGNEKYESRLHFLTHKNNGKYEVSYHTQEEYDRELQYAIDGGIDFFAQCWYPDGKGEERTVGRDTAFGFLASYYPELNVARKLYQSSKLNSKLNMCAIIFAFSAYSEADFDALIYAMKQD